MATADVGSLQGPNASHAGAASRWATELRAVPGSLPPFWIVCGLTLVVSHYQLWGRLNVAYKGLGIVVVVLMVLSAGFAKMLTRPQLLWLLLFELVMVINMAMGRFYDWSALFTTSSPPIILLRSLPLMLCGYTLARFPKTERTFLLTIAISYWLLCLPDFVGFVTSTQGGLDRSMQQVQTQGLGGDINARAWAQSYVSCFIYFAPLLLFFAIMLFRLYPLVSRQARLGIIVIQVTFVATAVLSGFGAVILLAALAVVLFGYFAPVRSFGYRAVWIAGSGCAVIFVDYVRRALLSAGNRSAAGQAFAKVTELLTGLFYRDTGVELVEQLQRGSSNRSLLLWNSIETFISHPLFGAGFQEDSTAVGGHSFLGDTAASFGLVGFVPVAAFFLTILLGLRRARRQSPTSWSVAASQMFIWTLLMGLILNPYLLEMLSLSYFLFLFLGFAIADAQAGPASSGVAGVRAAAP